MDLVKLHQYLPKQAVDQVLHLFNQEHLKVDIVPHRRTRHGDYRRLIDGTHVITINQGENPYRFLLTLIHELAHFKAFSHYGRMIKPHGIEWKNTFRQLMLPFLRSEIFPETVLRPLAHYFDRPSSHPWLLELQFELLVHFDPCQLVYDRIQGFGIGFGRIQWFR